VRGAKRLSHWLFFAYLTLAGVSVPYTLVRTRMFDASLGRLRSCLARAESGCASVELETARRLRPTDVRLEIADASLAILLHQLARAEGSMLMLENRGQQQGASLSPEARVDLLLLRGDLASAKGNPAEARDDFAAALPLLGDPELLAPRLQRIEARDKTARDQSTRELASLEQDFSDLFAVAAQGNRELMELRAAKAQAWLARLPQPEARQLLVLALNASRRAESAAETENRAAQPFDPGEPPTPPAPNTRSSSAGFLGSYDAQLARYRDRLARYNKERAEANQRQEQRAANAAEVSNAAIAQAKELLQDALQRLRALPAPLGDAAPSSGGPALVPAARPAYRVLFE